MLPDFGKVQDQFTKDECFETMSIANVRIHVKRTLKRVKVWHIFNQVVPLSMHGFINRTNLINRHPLSFELTTTSTLLYFVTDLLEFLIC